LASPLWLKKMGAPFECGFWVQPISGRGWNAAKTSEVYTHNKLRGGGFFQLNRVGQSKMKELGELAKLGKPENSAPFVSGGDAKTRRSIWGTASWNEPQKHITRQIWDHPLANIPLIGKIGGKKKRIADFDWETYCKNIGRGGLTRGGRIREQFETNKSDEKEVNSGYGGPNII